MATISLCMIVKNEEKVLARCLDSLAGLMDELIIVDTGSTDGTREIAKKYTDKVYDFSWNNDFSAARNFSFEKATMEYIYAPDADEVLDEENRQAFAKLKQALLPEIEIVQMKYATVTEFNTVLNAKTEYRPKLFKRLRTFQWIDPIHETLRLEPVIFDSDIVILHMPESMHSKRDFSIFEGMIKRGEQLSPKLKKMYATELYKTGDEKDLQQASCFFQELYEKAATEAERKYAAAVLMRHFRLQQNIDAMFSYGLKEMATNPSSEVCYELGQYYLSAGQEKEASLWFYNAYQETEAFLDIHVSGDYALQGLLLCYEILKEKESQQKTYYEDQIEMTKQLLSDWKLPEE